MQFTFVWYRRHWPHQTRARSESTSPGRDKVTSFQSQCSTTPLPSLVPCKYCSRSVCWLTKRFMKSGLFIFTPCLLHHYHPIHWDQENELVCHSLGWRPTQAQELFTLVPRLSGATSTVCLLSHSGHRHTRQPVHAMELFHQFCHWTFIRLSGHWAWLRWGY